MSYLLRAWISMAPRISSLVARTTVAVIDACQEKLLLYRDCLGLVSSLR